MVPGQLKLHFDHELSNLGFDQRGAILGNLFAHGGQGSMNYALITSVLLIRGLT
jgi:hypothetical protein